VSKALNCNQKEGFMPKLSRLVSLVATVMLTFTSTVYAQPIISFDAGPNGDTYPSAINEEGRIVGSFTDQNGCRKPKLRRMDLFGNPTVRLSLLM
jgi:hypothetical protein